MKFQLETVRMDGAFFAWWTNKCGSTYVDVYFPPTCMHDDFDLDRSTLRIPWIVFWIWMVPYPSFVLALSKHYLINPSQPQKMHSNFGIPCSCIKQVKKKAEQNKSHTHTHVYVYMIFPFVAIRTKLGMMHHNTA